MALGKYLRYFCGTRSFSTIGSSRPIMPPTTMA
jgi:hypothetical protein